MRFCNWIKRLRGDFTRLSSAVEVRETIEAMQLAPGDIVLVKSARLDWRYVEALQREMRDMLMRRGCRVGYSHDVCVIFMRTDDDIRRLTDEDLKRLGLARVEKGDDKQAV